MPTFNMNRTWSQAVALFQANFQLLAVIGGVFLLLPSLLLYMALPDFFSTLSMADGNPEQMEAMVLAMVGPLALYGSIAFVLQMVGYMAMIALMGDDRPTVGEAILEGLRSLFSVIAATLLFVVLYVVLALVVSLVTGLIVAATGGSEAIAGVLAFVLVIGLLVGTFYLAVRLSLTMPVIVLERRRNPFDALRRSWQLTAGHAARIFAFFLLLFVAYMVLSLVILGIFGGAVTAVGGPGDASVFVTGLLNGVVGALVAMLFSAILVGLYRQLAGSSSVQIDETFG